MSSAAFHTASMSVQVVSCGEVLKAKRMDPRYVGPANDRTDVRPRATRGGGRAPKRGVSSPTLAATCRCPPAGAWKFPEANRRTRRRLHEGPVRILTVRELWSRLAG